MPLNTHLTGNFYQLLGVAQSANKKEIRSAYLKLAKLYHPDANAHKKRAPASNKTHESIEHRFKMITNAYETLIDDEQRRHYNMSLFMSGDENSVQHFRHQHHQSHPSATAAEFMRRYGEPGGVSEEFEGHEIRMRNRKKMSRHFLLAAIVLFIVYRFSVYMMVKKRREAQLKAEKEKASESEAMGAVVELVEKR